MAYLGLGIATLKNYDEKSVVSFFHDICYEQPMHNNHPRLRIFNTSTLLQSKWDLERVKRYLKVK